MLPSITCNIPLARAQQDNTNFLTYTNTDLGFTIKYPSDWIVDYKSGTADNKMVRFTSADRVGTVGVVIQDIASEETGTSTTDDLANRITSRLPAGEKLLEVDKSGYFLSGHPAVRIMDIRSFEEPPLEVKSMEYSIALGLRLAIILIHPSINR